MRALRHFALFVLLLTLIACGRQSDGSAGPLPASESQAGGARLEDPAPQLIDDAPASPAFPPPQAWAAAPNPRGQVAQPMVDAVAAILVDEASGAVLFEKDAHIGLPPASLTKIATAILTLERGNLDAEVDIDVDSSSMRGSTVMGLRPGDRFSRRDLIYGLMLPSGNDAALALGRDIAGSDVAFVAEMNALMTRLGLRDSHFENPHGLGGRNHVASAHDLAMLARYAMTLPGFYDLVTARSYTARGSRVISFANVNSFLGVYAGADGIKTGYTRGAGQTLVASAYRNGHRLYAVVLNSPTRNDDAARLLNWGFTSFTWP